jgi:hypothetical protein
MQKNYIITCLFLLVVSSLRAQIFPVEVIKNNGASNKRVNIVFLGDGYQSTEQDLYITNVNTVVSTMFTQSPFLEYEKFFNVYAIKVPSVESGAKHAGTATDVNEPLTPVTNPDNYFGSRFDVSRIHRLLVPSRGGAINSIMRDNVPDFDQALVLVNSSVYGGSGGTFATSSTNVSAAEIAIHEIGHSFANLGDEYWFECTEKKNRSANNNPATVIWSNWIGSNGIDIFTIAGSSPTCYRPHANCKMRTLNQPFCAVCKQALIDKIYALVSPIDNFTPITNNVNFTGSSINFALGLILPNPNTLKIEWVLNGTTIANDVNNINVLSTNLNVGNNTLIAKVTDGTPLSRIYQPATSGYLNSVTWTINQAILPVELLDFNVQLVKNQAELTWETATEINSDYFEIQKSTDGTNFKRIGSVKAAGQSSKLLQYQFTDVQLVQNINYYRLKAVDKDGSARFSPIKTINRTEKLRYDIYPNPVTDVLSIQLSSQNAVDAEVSLFDLQGRRLVFLERQGTEGLFEDIDMSKFTAGGYFLRVKMGSTVIEKIIVKQ